MPTLPLLRPSSPLRRCLLRPCGLLPCSRADRPAQRKVVLEDRICFRWRSRASEERGRRGHGPTAAGARPKPPERKDEVKKGPLPPERCRPTRRAELHPAPRARSATPACLKRQRTPDGRSARIRVPSPEAGPPARAEPGRSPVSGRSRPGIVQRRVVARRRSNIASNNMKRGAVMAHGKPRNSSL